MTFNQFQLEAARTYVDLGSIEKNLYHMDLGIITEIGEFLDIIKKKVAYGKEIDLVHASEELADICWYAVNKATIRREKAYTLSPTLFFEDDLESLIYGFNNNCIIGCVILTARKYNIDIFKALDNNIEKLKVRYPEKFTTENALNRNLVEERKMLEK